MGQRRLEVDDRPAAGSEVAGDGREDRLLALHRVQAVLALVVGDEREPVGLAVLLGCNEDGVDVARGGIGVLVQLAVLQIQRPDVEDLAVARDLRLDGIGRIDGSRREHDRAVVDELRAALVVRAERHLRLLSRRKVEPEQLVVGADPLQMQEAVPVGGVDGRVVRQRVLGQVRDLVGVEFDPVDVAHGPRQRREDDAAAVGGEVGRLRLVDHVQVDDLLDFARHDVLDHQRLVLVLAHEVRQVVAVRRPRQPGHGVPPQSEHGDVLEPEILIEPFGQVPDNLAGARRDQHDVELPVLAVEGRRRDHLAGG